MTHKPDRAAHGGTEDQPSTWHSGNDLLTISQTVLTDQLDLMFGTSRRRMPTGEHVEVWREPADSGGRQAHFRKWFRITTQERGLAGEVDWNARETLMLQALEALGSEHVQVFDATSHSQDRSRRDLVTQHAGPTLQQWLALPVHRDGHSFVHVFQDCAHWFALARYALAALEVINRAGCLHLDIKADNLCIPLLGRLDPHQPEPFRLALDKLKLIDFAFSLWERRLPLEGRLGMDISKEGDYQSRQLRAVIVDCAKGNVSRIRQLDWRTDLYGLGWMLQNLLDGVNTEPAWTGWNRDRLEQARALVRELQGYDTKWQEDSGAHIPEMPHWQLIERIDGLLDLDDLRNRTNNGWEAEGVHSKNNPRTPTPVPKTQLARHLRPTEEFSAQVMYERGNQYLEGHGVLQNDQEAERWIRLAANQEHAEAQFALGQLYQSGRGLEVNPALALKWFIKAAEQGHAAAQSNVGAIYEDGGLGVTKNSKKALDWYRKAANSGDMHAQLWLGHWYQSNKNKASENEALAVKWFGRAAEQGHAEAQYILGTNYLFGAGVTLNVALAASWLEKAAQQRHSAAQSELGRMYMEGLGVDADDAQAFAWFRKAAESGHPEAQWRVGWLYQTGRGVSQDYEKALSWYRMAADQANADGAYCIGLMYEEGLGVRRNKKKAIHWYKIAGSLGHDLAEGSITRLNTKKPEVDPLIDTPQTPPPASPIEQPKNRDPLLKASRRDYLAFKFIPFYLALSFIAFILLSNWQSNRASSLANELALATSTQQYDRVTDEYWFVTDKLRFDVAHYLIAEWNSKEMADPQRISVLQALLWVRKGLHEHTLDDALESTYWKTAAVQGYRAWWLNKRSPDPEGKAWLAEATLLAEAGLRGGLFTLGLAHSQGVGVVRNRQKGGEYLARALLKISQSDYQASLNWRAQNRDAQNPDADPAASASLITQLALLISNELILRGNDRRFAGAILSGLQHAAHTLQDPAAALLLGDVLACRVSPPQADKAKQAYALAAKQAEWSETADQRRKLTLDQGVCRFE